MNALSTLRTLAATATALMAMTTAARSQDALPSAAEFVVLDSGALAALARLAVVPVDTPVAGRPMPVEYSDAYYTRLTIHRYASYAELPLFAAEYFLGQKLMRTTPQPGWVKPTHVTAAYALGGLFAVNTGTGLLNLWDARHDPEGRTRRILHTVLMLGADAGFAYTGSIAESARSSLDGARRHRNAALASMGVSALGTAIMWFRN